MRITYNQRVDAAYVHLTEQRLMQGGDVVPCALPDGTYGSIYLDFNDGVLIGIEVLGASAVLPDDVLTVASA
jgi:uncharacterized protein YuzE